MEIFLRKSCKPIVLISMSSIIISPSNGFNRNRVEINDDFPAPVRPTIPTFSLIRFNKIIHLFTA